MAVLVAAWAGLEFASRPEALGRRRIAAVWLAFLGGSVIAFIAYYRHVLPLFAESTSRLEAGPFLGVRWFRIGKFAQDLLLKFGLLPLVLAARGLAVMVTPALERVLKAWLLSGLGLAIVAFATPVPLRFEYLALGAVCCLAALGVEKVSPLTARVALALSLAVELALLVLLAAHRFRLISVILDSPRWPFPIGPP
jgi:hypothetical protein